MVAKDSAYIFTIRELHVRRAAHIFFLINHPSVLYPNYYPDSAVMGR
jgi:hypothetical protein